MPPPSFHRFLAADLTVAQRLMYNLEVELAKPDRQRVLNALNCQLLYLNKRIHLHKKILDRPRCLYHTCECHRAFNKSIKDLQLVIENAVEEVHDVALTLHCVASRTLCQIMMERLPRELRDMIYGFLIPYHFHNLQFEREDSFDPRTEPLSLWARGVTVYCMKPNRDVIGWSRPYDHGYVASTTFMGQEAHKELVLKFFESCAFRLRIVNGTETPSIDPWNYGVEPLRMVRKLEVICPLAEHAALLRVTEGKPWPFESLGLILKHCEANFRWTVKLFTPRDCCDRRSDMDLVFKVLTSCLSRVQIPNPKSITIMFDDDTWYLGSGSPFVYRKTTSYQGTLAAWLDIYHATAENEGDFESLGQRFKAYKLIQEKSGRPILEFQFEENARR